MIMSAVAGRAFDGDADVEDGEAIMRWSFLYLSCVRVQLSPQEFAVSATTSVLLFLSSALTLAECRAQGEVMCTRVG